MKKLSVALCAFVLFAFITLKVTSRKDRTSTQPTEDAHRQTESSPDSVTIRQSTEPAIPAPAETQTNRAFAANETNGIPLATYLEQWRAHYDGGEPRFPPGTDTNKLPAFLPTPHAPTPEETQAARERMEAAREQWRLELKGKGEYKEMFAKEEEWKEKSKAISKEMSLQEVITVMGLPTHVEKFVETSKGSTEAVAVPTRDLSSVMGMAFVYYSPDAQPPESGASIGELSKRLPFDYLFLDFDKEGKLVFVRWGKQAEELSLLRSASQGVEQH